MCIERAQNTGCDLAIHIEGNAVCTEKMLNQFYYHLISHTCIIIKKYTCTHTQTYAHYVFCVCILTYICIYICMHRDVCLWLRFFKKCFWMPILEILRGADIFRKYWMFSNLYSFKEVSLEVPVIEGFFDLCPRICRFKIVYLVFSCSTKLIHTVF